MVAIAIYLLFCVTQYRIIGTFHDGSYTSTNAITHAKTKIDINVFILPVFVTRSHENMLNAYPCDPHRYIF